MRIALLFVLLVSASLALQLPADENPQENGISAAESETFPVVEHNGFVVTLIADTVSRSPDGKHTTTSFLFMVENQNEKPGQHSQGSPVRFFGRDGELYRDASNGLPKTGSLVAKYGWQYLPHFDELPKPTDGSKTRLVRHWIHDELPQSANALEVDFGQNGHNHTFRFPIRRR